MGTEFNQAQYDAIYPEGIENHYWNSAKNRIVADLLKPYRATCNVLEIGCGKGVVLKYLLKKGFNVRGVELADLKIEKDLSAYIRTGTDVFDLNSEEYSNVDTILLCDVIEHLEEPSAFIGKIIEKFPKVKRFIVTVPARQEIFSNYDTFNGHYRRYDIKTLLSDFQQVKTKTAKITYSYHSLYWPAKVLLNTKGEREVIIKAPGSALQKAIHKTISIFLFLEYKILPSTWKGTSLLLDIELVK